MAYITFFINEDTLPDHDIKEFSDWIKFSIHQKNEIDIINPLADCDIEGVVTFIDYKGNRIV